MRAFGKTFLRGLAAILPISLTLYILWWLGSGAERLMARLLALVAPNGPSLPGLGLVLGVGIVFVVGLSMRAGLVLHLMAAIDRRLERLPVVKTVYGPLKDLMSFLAGREGEEQLDQVVKVSVGQPPMDLIGFLTRDSARDLTGLEEDAEQVAVYLPMSYQLGGYMVFVPRERVTHLDIGVDQALRIALTAGMSAGERQGPAG